jgi:hypothetical protein
LVGPLVALPWGDDARLVGEHDRLDPVAEAELHEDAGDVSLHRRLAHDQLGGDLGRSPRFNTNDDTGGAHQPR